MREHAAIRPATVSVVPKLLRGSRGEYFRRLGRIGKAKVNDRAVGNSEVFCFVTAVSRRKSEVVQSASRVVLTGNGPESNQIRPSCCERLLLLGCIGTFSATALPGSLSNTVLLDSDGVLRRHKRDGEAMG